MINNLKKNKDFVNIIKINETENLKILKKFLDISKDNIKPGLYISPQYDFQLITNNIRNKIGANDYINYLNSIDEEFVSLTGTNKNSKITNTKILNDSQIDKIVGNLNDFKSFDTQNKKRSYFDFIFPMRLLKDDKALTDNDFLNYVMQPIFLVIRIFDISKKVDIDATISKVKDKTNVNFNSNDIKKSDLISEDNSSKYEFFFLVKEDNNIIFYSDVIMQSINNSTNIKNILYAEETYFKKTKISKKDSSFYHLGINISFDEKKITLSSDFAFSIRNKPLEIDVNYSYAEYSSKFKINNFFKAAANNEHVINFNNFKINENGTLIHNNLFLDNYTKDKDTRDAFADAIKNESTEKDIQLRNITQLYYELISSDDTRLSLTNLQKFKSEIQAWNNICHIITDNKNIYSNYFELTNASADLWPMAFSTVGMRGYYILTLEGHINEIYEGLKVPITEHSIDLNELYKYIVNNIIRLDVTLL